MAFREKLAADIRAHFKESKWEDMLQEQLAEVLEVRPVSPYDYLQRKVYVRPHSGRCARSWTAARRALSWQSCWSTACT